MKKKILCTMMSMVMVASLFAGCGTDSGTENSASDNSKTEETGQTTSDDPYAAYAGTTISVAAIETGYGSQMWQEVTDAFTEETGIQVELTTDKKLEDVIGPSMQGGEYPDVIHLATGREAALTEQFIKGNMITDITDVLSMKVPGEDKLVSEKMTALPAVKAGGDSYSYTWFEQAWIPSGAEHQDAAKLFISYLYSDKACEIFAKAGAIQPVLGIADKLEGDNVMFYSIYDNGAKAAMGNFASFEAIPGIEVRTVFFDPVNSLVSGDMTEQEWIDGIISASDQMRANLK